MLKEGENFSPATTDGGNEETVTTGVAKTTKGK